MRVPLDDTQLDQARQWAADLGVPEEEVIADAEAAKGRGYAGAHAAAAGTMSRMAGAGGGQMYGAAGPRAELEAEAGG